MTDILDTCQNDTSYGMICQTFISKLYREKKVHEAKPVAGSSVMDTQKYGSLFFFPLFKTPHHEK